MDSEKRERPLKYRSFILSLWEEGGALPGSQPVWRISLEDPRTSERRGFADLAELARYLGEWVAVHPDRREVPE